MCHGQRADLLKDAHRCSCSRNVTFLFFETRLGSEKLSQATTNRICCLLTLPLFFATTCTPSSSPAIGAITGIRFCFVCLLRLRFRSDDAFTHTSQARLRSPDVPPRARDHCAPLAAAPGPAAPCPAPAQGLTFPTVCFAAHGRPVPTLECVSFDLGHKVHPPSTSDFSATCHAAFMAGSLSTERARESSRCPRSPPLLRSEEGGACCDWVISLLISRTIPSQSVCSRQVHQLFSPLFCIFLLFVTIGSGVWPARPFPRVCYRFFSQ
jgi:hypothetical protein